MTHPIEAQEDVPSYEFPGSRGGMNQRGKCTFGFRLGGSISQNSLSGWEVAVLGSSFNRSRTETRRCNLWTRLLGVAEGITFR
jgi:hypothetical protein